MARVARKAQQVCQECKELSCALTVIIPNSIASSECNSTMQNACAAQLCSKPQAHPIMVQPPSLPGCDPLPAA